MSPADCPYSIDFHLHKYYLMFSTIDLTGVPSIQVCCPILLSYHIELAKQTLNWDYLEGAGGGGKGASHLYLLPLPFNPCGNFSGTSRERRFQAKGSIGPLFYPLSFDRGPTISQVIMEGALPFIITHQHLVCERYGRGRR